MSGARKGPPDGTLDAIRQMLEEQQEELERIDSMNDVDLERHLAAAGVDVEAVDSQAWAAQEQAIAAMHALPSVRQSLGPGYAVRVRHDFEASPLPTPARPRWLALGLVAAIALSLAVALIAQRWLPGHSPAVQGGAEPAATPSRQ